MEIIALGLLNQENGKQLYALLESYTELSLPGSSSEAEDVDSAMAKARKELAKEVNKVFIIKPIGPEDDGLKINPALAGIQAKQTLEDAKREAEESSRLRRRTRKPPA